MSDGMDFPTTETNVNRWVKFLSKSSETSIKHFSSHFARSCCLASSLSCRALGFTGEIHITIWDLDDCHKGTGGPRCPEEHDGGGDETITSVPLKACNEEIPEGTSTTTVRWYYTVESSSDDPSAVAESVCGAMGSAVIGAFDDECATRRRLRERRLEIQGYSPSVTCELHTTCVPTNPDSNSCAVYEADVDIAYDDEGDNSSAGEVSETVTTVAEDTLTGDGSDGVEAAVADDLDDSDESLTFVGWGNPNEKEEVGAGLSGETYADESSQGLSRAAKIALASMSVLLLLLLLLCVICWRRRTKEWDSSKSVDTGETQVSPGRRGAGGGSSRGSRGSASDFGDDMTYMTSDFNNLALHHSKLDVHKCASASCNQCNPIIRNNAQGVFFVNSRGGAPLSDIVEEEYKSSSEYKSEISASERNTNNADVTPVLPPPSLPPPIQDPPTVERKSFFSKFRRNQSSAVEGPSISPQGSADGDEQIEIEI